MSTTICEAQCHSIAVNVSARGVKRATACRLEFALDKFWRLESKVLPVNRSGLNTCFSRARVVDRTKHAFFLALRKAWLAPRGRAALQT
jgi:hypothetical protein